MDCMLHAASPTTVNCVLARNAGCGKVLHGNSGNSSRCQPFLYEGFLVLAERPAQEIGDRLTQLQGRGQNSLQPSHAA